MSIFEIHEILQNVGYYILRCRIYDFVDNVEFEKTHLGADLYIPEYGYWTASCKLDYSYEICRTYLVVLMQTKN